MPTKSGQHASQRADVSSTPDESLILPRLLTRPQAAAYLALTVAAFDDWIRRGLIQGPLPGTHRWDRKAIDAALDRASGLTPITTNESDYAAWKEAHAGSPARDSQS
ncbi:MAG: hypothetical protein AB1490_05380 [Pseudomonadota bacterium]